MSGEKSGQDQARTDAEAVGDLLRAVRALRGRSLDEAQLSIVVRCAWAASMIALPGIAEAVRLTRARRQPAAAVTAAGERAHGALTTLHRHLIAALRRSDPAVEDAIDMKLYLLPPDERLATFLDPRRHRAPVSVLEARRSLPTAVNTGGRS